VHSSGVEMYQKSFGGQPDFRTIAHFVVSYCSVRMYKMAIYIKTKFGHRDAEIGS